MIQPKTMSSRDRAKAISLLARDGLTSREIARALRISHQRVCQIAHVHSIPLARPGCRHFGLYISDRRAALIRELAREANVSPATMIERMTRVVLDDGPDQARRRLGKLTIATEARS